MKTTYILKKKAKMTEVYGLHVCKAMLIMSVMKLFVHILFIL